MIFKKIDIANSFNSGKQVATPAFAFIFLSRGLIKSLIIQAMVTPSLSASVLLDSLIPTEKAILGKPASRSSLYFSKIN